MSTPLVRISFYFEPKNTEASTLFTMPLNKPKDRKENCFSVFILKQSYKRAISILNRQQKNEQQLVTFPPATQREGQLEGHLSGSVFDEAPDIDKH